jgi:histidinol-phosphate/aromatic aminotransferase/cobyric acid decarboxylase-like protein
MRVYQTGGLAGLRVAYANLREPQLHSALRRFRDQRPMGSPQEPLDPDAIRAKIRAIPHDQLLSRLADLIDRKV